MVIPTAWRRRPMETSYAAKFSGKRTYRVVNGVGHNLLQEAPQAFADAVIDVSAY